MKPTNDAAKNHQAYFLFMVPLNTQKIAAKQIKPIERIMKELVSSEHPTIQIKRINIQNTSPIIAPIPNLSSLLVCGVSNWVAL